MTRAERRGSFLRRAATSETAPRGEEVTAMISATTPARVRAVVHSSTRAVVCSRVRRGRMVEESVEMGEWGSGEVGGEEGWGAAYFLGGDFSGVGVEGVASSRCFFTRVSMSSREKWDFKR